MQKRVAAIHDISCLGRCSLTVALPVLSAGGIETSIIPTAILSTHTGGFPGFTFRDLSSDILPIAEHWKSLNIRFDAMYTGYLASFQQLEIVSELLDMFSAEDNLLFIDPVMGDNGKFYTSFYPEFAGGMTKLCSKADVIIPNLTEAALLLGEEYRNGPYTKDYIKYLLQRLAELGPQKVVVTGVYFDDDRLGAAAYDRSTEEIAYILNEKIPGSYHGTGDIFGSTLLAALLNGFSLYASVEIASKYTADSIRCSYASAADRRFGVNFEYSLGELAGVLRPAGL